MRFPLRDALMSFQDVTRPPSVQEAEASSSSLDSKGPLKVKMTSKAKHRAFLGHRKRHDLDPPGIGEMHAQPMPRPPPETTARQPPKKAMNTFGNQSRMQARREAEGAGWSTWMAGVEHAQHAQSEPDLHSSVAKQQEQMIRGTLTSSARAVLSHSRRFAAESMNPSPSHSPHGSSGGGGSKGSGAAKKPAPDPMAAWSPQRQSRGLPKPVREWVCRGLEFTDGGLGIGDRFDLEIEKRARRAPGHIYDQDFGNIARWNSEASVPTKQPEGRHHSTQTHKIGARRDISGKRDRQRPGPGTYELRGFAQENALKTSKRPKGEAPRSLSPPSSPLGSTTRSKTSMETLDAKELASLQPCLREAVNRRVLSPDKASASP